MNCSKGRHSRITPLTRSNIRNKMASSKPPRVNGWSWPPQAFQVLCWLVFSYMGIAGFGIYIPLLPPWWNYVAYTVVGTTFLVHFVTHLAATSVDPADAVVRAKQSYVSPVPLFDRSKQPHVIQDLHCYLCDVKVGPRVKHCGVCNKCVADFDHHCKWLNTCVGGRNYWYFFSALSSAALGVILLLMVILSIFILHFLEPSSLRTAPQFAGVLGNGTWLVFLPWAPIQMSSAGLLVLAFITVLMCFICLLLLGHLLGLHLYLLYRGMSTFDYIKEQRQKEARNSQVEAGTSQAARSSKKAAVQNSGNAVNCEPALPHSSSTCKSDDRGPMTSHLPGSVCIELEDFKHPVEQDTSLPPETERPFEVMGSRFADSTGSLRRDADEIALSDFKTSTIQVDREAQSAKRTSVTSVHSVPGVQNPLGSSVMTPDSSPH